MKEKKLYNLADYLKNKREIEKLKEKYQEIKTQAENIVAQYSSGPKPTNRTQDGSGLEKYVVRMLEITEKINQLNIENTEIYFLLTKLPYKEKILLHNLYINGIPLKELSYRMKKSYRYLQKIKSSGLVKFSELQKKAKK